MSIPDHLITPLDWSAEALRHAAEWTGQPEGARALVESRRYLAMHELIERLRAELAQARDVLWSIQFAIIPNTDGVPVCPECWRDRSKGHAPECSLSAALGGEGGVMSDTTNTARGLADAATLLRQAVRSGNGMDYEQIEEHCRALAAVQRAAKLLTERDEVLEQLRTKRDELKADQVESDAVREQLADLLRRTAIAVRGPEPELTRWSWHDVPDRVAAAIAALGGAVQAAAEAMRERDELAARLEAIERAEPVAWIERITGRLADPTDEHRTRFPMAYRPLIDRPAPAAAPEQAEPDHCEDARGMVCATSGLLGATSGVGRECDYWAGGVCTSPHPCKHQQQSQPCRTCGPDGCSDSTSCPRGER